MTRLAALTVAVALAAGACSSSGTKEVSYGDVMDVVLISSGDDAVELRYDLTEGDTFRWEMVMEARQRVAVDGEDMGGAPAPSIRVVVLVTVVEAADGNYTLEMEFKTAEVPGLEGATIVTTMTDRGLITDADISGLGEMDATLRQMTEQMMAQVKTMSVPFPEEPVGVGATWQGGLALDVFGMRAEATYTFELVDVEGTVVTLDVNAEQRFLPGPGELPGMPAGAEMTVEEGQMTTTGQMVFDLESPAPDSGSLATGGTMAMTASEDGESHHIEIDMDLDQEMRRLR